MDTGKPSKRISPDSDDASLRPLKFRLCSKGSAETRIKGRPFKPSYPPCTCVWHDLNEPNDCSVMGSLTAPKTASSSTQVVAPTPSQRPLANTDATRFWLDLSRYLSEETPRTNVDKIDHYEAMRNLDYDVGIPASLFLDLFYLCSCNRLFYTYCFNLKPQIF
ncbi:hypothetical protein DFP72DRAFT_1070674 [Ephemerocybe angulata]|uniref:Uncharacterized protein n=1 Tax=Ephemerocybe angulata TaxID=980116 RepID=A0A8H6HU99_9AGAR|nr:hypothetical protein DFP72DRAFT_1070674 [Tulosesus angulatus]